MTFGGAFGGAWVGGMAQKAAAAQADYYLHFDGAGYVNCGSDASLQNLLSASFTVDFWVRVEQPAHFLISRTPFREGSGWLIDNYAGGIDRYTYWTPIASAVFSGGQAYALPSWDIFDIPINTWAHITAVFDGAGTRKIYIAVNGTWCTYKQQDTFSGTPVNDAGNTLLFGADHGYDGPANFHYGDFAWVRISSGLRWALGSNFTPPEMAAAPAVDGTTVELWAMDDGSGTTAAASVTTPGNDGALTNCTWSEH